MPKGAGRTAIEKSGEPAELAPGRPGEANLIWFGVEMDSDTLHRYRKVAAVRAAEIIEGELIYHASKS